MDTINEIFTTSTGQEFDFDSTGTGESQNAYLKSSLSSNSDRCLIAMFDESEHMDEIMTRDVQNKFKELYDSGKLLLGLMACPGKEPMVIEYE